jgi:hypothetical protein
MVHDRFDSPVNTILETESKLYQLSCLPLPTLTSADTAQTGGQIDLNGYRVLI